MDGLRFLSSWPALYLWQQELDRKLTGTRLARAFTYKKDQLDLCFENATSALGLSWQSVSGSARLWLKPEPSLPRKRVEIFKQFHGHAVVEGVSIQANDRLIRIEFDNQLQMVLGFYPQQLNVALLAPELGEFSFFKTPAIQFETSEWLQSADDPRVADRFRDLELDPEILHGFQWDPQENHLVPASAPQPMSDISRIILHSTTKPVEPVEINWPKLGRTVSKRWAKKHKKMELELEQAQHWAEMELEAQALAIAHSAGLKIVDGAVILPAELSPNGEQLTVAVESDGTSLGDHAQKLFQKVRKSKTQITAVQDRLKIVESELRELDILLASNSPVEIEDFLKEHGEAAPGTRNAPAKRLPFTRYTAPSGIDILVGRGARDNDALTFKIAHKEDWWLHARGVPGSHVILKTGKREPEQRDLLEAARLAARNSNAKHAGIVVVQYCQRKHVSKPKGSPPGVVLVHQEKTLTIDLSELT